MLAATVGLATLGCLAVAAAILSPALSAPSASTPGESSTPPRSAAPSTPAPTRNTAKHDAAVRVSELADPSWIDRVASSTSIPARALAAYAGAAIAVEATHPGCGLGWNTLAAIGLVESEHGTMNGSVIGRNGIAVPRIIGIPLDGTETLAVPDTDAGRLDGDPRWDRAVGPMQFLPETWDEFGRDGSGDGRVDIHHIDDAALTAAAYLCASGGDLTEAANWIAAITAYNPSVEYNNRVARAATAYATTP
ncbi:lytic murein transglycosylase [Agromyces atrinae]|uniref:lytic transglycosylase domain-containing protein n=1 Tax=Agromyces atrinae TaxID=592376 RepID=UPI001F59D631|nr:lytic murein transglycosylase [Agromyces atrinae]MCI2956662.1 lytic murein transglycosylase [Agromyces atrinae]